MIFKNVYKYLYISCTNDFIRLSTRLINCSSPPSRCSKQYTRIYYNVQESREIYSKTTRSCVKSRKIIKENVLISYEERTIRTDGTRDNAWVVFGRFFFFFFFCNVRTIYEWRKELYFVSERMTWRFFFLSIRRGYPIFECVYTRSVEKSTRNYVIIINLLHKCSETLLQYGCRLAACQAANEKKKKPESL